MINKDKKVAILQSDYIPWKGYFDIIDSVDEFIFYDEVQYTLSDWRNRNKIKTPKGAEWISIPVVSKGVLSNNLKINEAQVVDSRWVKSHWNSIKYSYSRSTFFGEYEQLFKELYQSCVSEKFLCQINYKFIYAINDLLGIKTKISFSQEYGLIEGKTEKLVDLCIKSGATEYLSGPSAKNYIDEKIFKDAGIKLTWMDYSKYRNYPQLYPPFEHGVSILDLIFNTGTEAINYIRDKQ